ncbi:IucA/IucC family C-terminal-domain containing protein [Brevibacillus sp. SYSU BS000544]|uniref:IucA/IucC family C-terminal-domain containing protein n=1 Tax=Brevibacillus sp. SYSU BS000544 TaxID=3416443 RepID=UPI003CE5919E
MALGIEQIEQLEREYRIAFAGSYDHRDDSQSEKSLQFSGADLLGDEKLRQLMGVLCSSLQAPNSIVAASLFAKYYSYLLLNAGFYSVMQLRRNLSLSLSNLTLVVPSDKWSPTIELKDEPSDEPKDISREQLLLKMIHTVVEENLRPLYTKLAEITYIKSHVLWAHASYSVHHLYDVWSEKQGMTEAELAAILGKVQELNIEFQVIDHPIKAGEKLRIRKECCLRCLLPEGSKCTTCPGLDERERVVALQNYLKLK